MKNYQILLTVTITAESGDEALDLARDFMSAATIGEPGPMVDYSVEEIQEEYDIPPERTRNERLQAAADAGYDTWEDYRGEK